MQSEIEKRLFELQDEKYKEFHSKLCPNTENIIGVRVPVLRDYAKEIVKGDFLEYLNTAKDTYYEEIMLQGMVISLSKLDIKDKIKYIEKFVPKISNWAICDTFVAGLKIKTKDLELVWEFIQPYLNSNEEFKIRFAVVMMLDYYINDKYIDKVITTLDKIENKEYYVQMAIAWTISFCFIKFPNKTMEYLKSNNRLDKFTYNKAIQKIIESYRVKEDTKKVLKKMKQ